MKITNNYNPYRDNRFKINNTKNSFEAINDRLDINLSSSPSFKSNPIRTIKDFTRYLKVQKFILELTNYLKTQPNSEQLAFRNISLENIEGLQFGIKVFKGLSMKDIQYLSENLHVIAIKRGCNNMCGHCYADAKPSKREMSWEDFTSITKGFKEIRKRLNGLPLFGENMTKEENTTYKTTELFYDADCMNLVLKDKKGREHDFRELVEQISDMGRKSVFDTSGWAPNNERMQKRAETYAEYFSHPENMEKLNQFNLSFNVFNASYIAAIRALKSSNHDRYLSLRNKFTDRISNAIFTFTPLLKYKYFQVMDRCFGPNAHNAEHFDLDAMISLILEVSNKLEKRYLADLAGEQKYVKSSDEIKQYMNLASAKMFEIDTALNSVGRMKQFMNEFGIKAPMQDHTESTKIMAEDIRQNGRYHRYLAHKLIDTDGKVYHMDYARFFPTEIQLNLKDKTEAPKLANLNTDFVVTKEIINRPETQRPLSDFI